MKQFKNQDLYEKLYSLQENYNKHTNITRINSKEDYCLRHIKDSLALERLLPKKGTLIDVGSGAGYPGLPIAIEKPELQVTLNDSIQKKTKYLNLAAQELGLKNITVLTGRAEALGQDKKYRENFDMATARAVAETNVLLELLSPLIKEHGALFIMKASNIDSELARAKNAEDTLGLKLERIERYSIEALERTILVYQKIKKTPDGYPRKPGTPEKKPL